MICFVILIFVFIVLFCTYRFLNKGFGEMAEVSLRKKIVEDTTNSILFLIIFWCLLKGYATGLPLRSLLVICCLMLLYLNRAFFLRLLSVFKTMVLEKVAFSATFGALIKRLAKNQLPSEARPKASRQTRQDGPISSSHNSTIYRDHIFMTVIFFCKITVILAVIFWGLSPIIREANYMFWLLLFEGSDPYLSVLTDLFVIINNVGLIFTCLKFRWDYIASHSVSSDNPRYLELKRRMERNEHEI